ncbi:MAG: hypothetical protein JKY21_08665, partial [Alcanivorax sp.]|nr:hypothetical protein [Alcanivorax sp.]
MDAQAPHTALSRSLVFLMAATTGLVVASNYYAQPLLHTIADRLDLAPGVNVMDLGHLSEEVQGLVIAACLEEAWEHCSNAVLVVP